jgi:hypothetical protein
MLLRRDRWEGSLNKGEEHRISSATDVNAAIAALDGWTRTQVSLVADDGTVLAVGGGPDDFLVQFLLREDGGEWLVIGSDEDGEADLAIGRQQAPYPRRTLTDAATAKAAAAHFLSTQQRDPTLNWEQSW